MGGKLVVDLEGLDGDTRLIGDEGREAGGGDEGREVEGLDTDLMGEGGQGLQKDAFLKSVRRQRGSARHRHF